jgi:TRAP transporter TAXI family solute receptor
MTAILLMLLGLASPAVANAAADRPWATIGTGSLTGVYFNTGKAIKKTLARYPGDQVIKMSVEATEGSLENLEAVTSGRFYFGLIQSDIQYKAWHGTEGSIWAGNPQKNLRAVFSLYTEAVNLVASRRPDIQSLQDLKAFRRGVNLGKTGSGDYVNAHEVLAASEIDPLQDLRAVYASPVRALSLFERREIDAFFFTAGHPAAQFHEVAGGRRQARFVPLQPKEEMLAQYPYYKRTLIPAKFYPAMGHDQDVATIGVKATLVASAETPEWMVYGVVKTVAENLGYFKTQLLVFHEMDRAGMLEGLSAPIHPGALKYYREAGLKP